MIFVEWINLACIGLFGATLIWAAASDMMSLKIPNRTVLTILALFPIYISSAGPSSWSLAALGGSLLVAAIIFAVGFIMFAFNLFGGGDVKMLAAVALWAGPSHIVMLLLGTALIGGFLALALASPLRLLLPYLAAATNTNTDFERLMSQPIPYGVAIAAGGLLVAIRLI